MQEISFHEAFSLTSAKLTPSEIARKIGLSRQTVSAWPSLVRGPQKAKQDLFLTWYRREICIKNTRFGLIQLIGKYKHNLPSTCYGIEWFDKEPEGYVSINLAWFFSNDYFFWTNRKGQAGNCEQWTHEGQDFHDFNRLVEQDRINEIVGLALL